MPAVVLTAGALLAQAPYVPPPGQGWERRSPEAVGMDGALVREAIEFAQANETPGTSDLELAHYLVIGDEPYDEVIGPSKERGAQTGVIVRHGYVVADWGEPDRVDMTFSVTKSFLSTTIGLAWEAGLIRELDDTVLGYMAPMELPAGDGEPGVARGATGRPDPALLFESEHNRRITWNHLLRQTSDWEGTLWGKPDWADRPGEDVAANRDRERDPPGSVWKYNDVRVNLLALAGLMLWRQPLPVVLRERVMDPIGASSTWRWFGYDDSWVTVDGLRMQSVAGGGHWGGGMFLNAWDQARFGLFTLRRGLWGDQQLLDERWFEHATMPTKANPGYGFMNYFLNRPGAEGRKRYPAAPDEAYAHLGSGTNMIYVDPVHDLVVVARWIEGSAIPEFLAKLLASVADRPSG